MLGLACIRQPADSGRFVADVGRSMNERRRQLVQRLFFFGAGAGLSYLLIATPFHWLETHTALPVWAVSACSIGVSTTFFFIWNYTINFPTRSRKRDALVRYLAAVAFIWLLSSTTLTILKHVHVGLDVRLGPALIDMDIVATQVLLSGLKFLLYHKWVFPLDVPDRAA